VTLNGESCLALKQHHAHRKQRAKARAVWQGAVAEVLAALVSAGPPAREGRPQGNAHQYS